MHHDQLQTGGKLKPWQARQFINTAFKKRVPRPVLHIQCLVCSRQLNTFGQRLWHRLVCWKRHPKQGGRLKKL